MTQKQSLRFPVGALVTAFSVFLLWAFSFTLHAQSENVWAFGSMAGVDFNGNTLRAIKTNIYASEGCTSICDVQGQLLFYSDGYKVGDRNHDVMPNGINLTNEGNITSSTTQGAIIIPMPGEPDRYYIFSLGQMSSRPTFGRLYYSIVDMTLNDGLGDVTTKGIIFDSLLWEQMTAVSGNNCNTWLIVVSRVNNDFKAYNIDANGINSGPVISPGAEQKALSNSCEILGTIDISPDRTKLGIVQDKVILYNFDPASGKITHPVILDTFPIVSSHSSFYGLCFSPDNSKLYVSLSEVPVGSDRDPALYQFDLSSGDSLTMVNSKTLIATIKWLYLYALKRAPDGKVYGTAKSTASLHVINQPNIAGTGCQFVANGFSLLEGTVSFHGLPNQGNVSPAKKHSFTIDSVLCSEPRTLRAQNIAGRNYVWEDGTSGHTRTVDSPGIYWVRYQVPINTPCKYEIHIDSFRVVFRFITNNIYTTTEDSGLCEADTIRLQARNLNGINYVWEGGSTGKHRKINQTGIYQVHYEIDSLCENHVDSFVITYPEKDYEVSFHVDTLVCQAAPIVFQNTSDAHFDNFIWSFGDHDSSALQNPEHTYIRPGNYEVMLIGKIGDICPDTAFQTIIVDSAIANIFLVDAYQICVGENITFYPQTDSTTQGLYWQFGDGIEMATPNEMMVQHAYDHAGQMPVMLTYNFRACPDTSFIDTISVYALPQVFLGPDSGLCLNGSPIILRNREMSPTSTYHNLWSTGDTTERIKVLHPGNYSLTVRTEPIGCSTTASVTVYKTCYIDVPNAFTPNGDGENDHFFPRQFLSENVTGFRMQIFNRWGQQLFETTQLDGCGWDGKFNNKKQPTDVYIYRIDVSFNKGQQEHYKGNVTLLR